MVLDKGLYHSPFSGFNFEAEIRFSKDKTASAEEAYSVKRDSRQLYKINLYRILSVASNFC
jgi:hypothetical protein